MNQTTIYGYKPLGTHFENQMGIEIPVNEDPGFFSTAQTGIVAAANVAQTTLSTLTTLAIIGGLIYLLYTASKHAKGISAAARAARESYGR